MSLLPVNDYPLASHTTIRLGGFCSAYFPESYGELIYLVTEFYRGSVPFCVVGRMSNILPADGYAEKRLIFTDKLTSLSLSDDTVTLGCGTRMSRVIFSLAKMGYSLLPNLIGVPGSVGGMVAQNASCYGQSISSQLICCRIYSLPEEKILVLKNEEMAFSYRTSLLKTRKYILLDATFQLYKADAMPSILEVTKKRKQTSPECPSLGSVFLRHNDISIGYLLDKLGQKGRRFGGIMVSRRHAGVLVNENSATAEEYIFAVNTLSELINAHYGFVPKCEVEFLR